MLYGADRLMVLVESAIILTRLRKLIAEVFIEEVLVKVNLSLYLINQESCRRMGRWRYKGQKKKGKAIPVTGRGGP
jgi:hypothetical protein